jgi:hypothetical protein
LGGPLPVASQSRDFRLLKATIGKPVIVLPNLPRPRSGYHRPLQRNALRQPAGRIRSTVNFSDVELQKK